MKILQLTSGEPVVIKGLLKKKLFVLLQGDLAFREIPFITSEQSLKIADRENEEVKGE